MENGIGGAFGYINVDGPNTNLRRLKPNVDAHKVSLKFKFVRRDTGAPVIIPWMQFSFFDFDENQNSGDGQEVHDPPTTPTPLGPPRCPTNPHSPPHPGLVNPLRSVSLLRDSPSTRSPRAPR